jgi:cell division protein FtsB
MPATPETLQTPRPRVRRADSFEPLRRARVAAPARSFRIWRRALNFLLVFATVVLLVDALVGERGLVATTRARRMADELADKVQRLRRENAALRESARRLKEDSTTIESVARKELGLIRPDEILVVIKDLKPSRK